MSIEKENFLRTKLITLLQRLDPSTPPKWGSMSVQHMIEHFAGDALTNANGKIKRTDIITPAQNLPRMREFMMSEKPFKENTKNPLLGELPPPLKNKTIQGAIGELQQELIHFFEAYEQNPTMVVRNPFYGDLDFEQNVQLLYKHALHHLRQFGIDPLTG